MCPLFLLHGSCFKKFKNQFFLIYHLKDIIIKTFVTNIMTFFFAMFKIQVFIIIINCLLWFLLLARDNWNVQFKEEILTYHSGLNGITVACWQAILHGICCNTVFIQVKILLLLVCISGNIRENLFLKELLFCIYRSICLTKELKITIHLIFGCFVMIQYEVFLLFCNI